MLVRGLCGGLWLVGGGFWLVGGGFWRWVGSIGDRDSEFTAEEEEVLGNRDGLPRWIGI